MKASRSALPLACAFGGAVLGNLLAGTPGAILGAVVGIIIACEAIRDD